MKKRLDVLPTWNHYFQYLEGYPMLIEVDITAHDTHGELFPYVQTIRFGHERETENGLPHPSDIEQLQVYRMALERAATEKRLPMTLVGCISGNGITEMFFYSKNKNDLHTAVYTAYSNPNEVEKLIYSSNDPNWDKYFCNLFPTWQEQLEVFTNTAINQIIDYGTNTDRPFVIRHEYVFYSEDNRNRFVNKMMDRFDQSMPKIYEGDDYNTSQFPVWIDIPVTRLTKKTMFALLEETVPLVTSYNGEQVLWSIPKTNF